MFNVIVLSLFPRPAAIFDGVVGTVVVAGEATETLSVVRPLWMRMVINADGVRGAYLFTTPATSTTVGHHMKRFVGYQMFHEHMTYHATVHAGPSPANDMVLVLYPVFDEPGITLQRDCRCSLLLPFAFRRVHIHEGKTDIRLGHQQRVGAVHMHPLGRQVVTHHVHGFANGVTCGTQCPTVVACGIHYAQMSHKASHRQGWTPSVHGKAEAYPLTRFQVEADIFSLTWRHENQTLFQEGGQKACGPSCVACARKVEYHAAKITIFL